MLIVTSFLPDIRHCRKDSVRATYIMEKGKSLPGLLEIVYMKAKKAENKYPERGDFFHFITVFPVDTRRRFNFHNTSIRRHRRRIDVL